MGKRTTHCPKGHEYTEENTCYSTRNRTYKDGTAYIVTEKRCRQCIKDNATKERQDNPEGVRIRARKSSKKRLAELRKEAIEAYGGKCNCECGCGIAIPEYLHLDHVDNDGAEHRRELGINGGSHKMAIWAKKNNWPDKLQLLCHNCGMAKAWYGSCPRIGGTE